MAQESFRRDNAATTALKSLPNFEIEKLRHLLTIPNDASFDSNKCKSELLRLIRENEMYPYFERIRTQLGEIDNLSWLDEIKEKNRVELMTLDEKIEFAEKNYGSFEVKDAILCKANYYFKIGNHEKVIIEYEKVLESTVGINSKLEVVLGILRVAFFFNDLDLLLKYMDKAKGMIDWGGDWEMRNRLSVYEAMQLILCRKFQQAGELLLKSLSTFTATELISLEELVFYAIVTAILVMDRNTIKTRILNAPEVNQVASNSPFYDLIRDYYNSDYSNYLQNLVATCKIVEKDRFLARHLKFILRQGRLPAYKQFLRPYKSVELTKMAQAFNVSPSFLEKELVSYISGMRLDVKINKVNGIIENNIADSRNVSFIEIIREGDLLINRIQKLSRIIEM